MQESTNIQPQETPVYHKGILDLSLSRFIDCQVNGNLYSLVISGDPDKIDLELAWLDIQQEYAEAIGDHVARLYYTLQKEFIVLSGQLHCIEAAIRILEGVYSADLAKELNVMSGTKFQFNPSNIERYQAELKNCFQRSRIKKMRINLLQLRIDALHSKTPSGKPTRESYLSILITLTDHAGIHLDENITVFEFCQRIKRFNEYVHRLKPKG